MKAQIIAGRFSEIWSWSSFSLSMSLDVWSQQSMKWSILCLCKDEYIFPSLVWTWNVICGECFIFLMTSSIHTSLMVWRTISVYEIKHRRRSFKQGETVLIYGGLAVGSCHLSYHQENPQKMVDHMKILGFQWGSVRNKIFNPHQIIF